MRRYRPRRMFRRDERALTLIVGAIIIVIIALLALVFYVRTYADDLGDRATSDDIAIIEAQGSVRIIIILDGSVGQGNIDAKVNYDVPENDPVWSFAPMGWFLDDEHKIKCEMRCTGPGDFIDKTHQTKKFTGLLAYKNIDFDVMRFPVELPGKYTIVMELELDGKDLGSTTVYVTVQEESSQ